MCLVALAIGANRRFPLVVASNRDEYFDRASAALDWWTAPGSPRQLLGGRDLAAGGTWFGLEPGGRLALVTNVRDPSRHDPRARSRGELVTRWLGSDQAFEPFWQSLEAARYNGFNLVCADLVAGNWRWASNAGDAVARSLNAGSVYGLSNAGLDVPWPKVTRLKARLAAALAAHDNEQSPRDALTALTSELFAALSDPTPADDRDLPATGVPIELERQLSPAFIRTADGRYGTRCSTLLIRERGHDERLITHVLERSGASLRWVTLDQWPLPRRATE